MKIYIVTSPDLGWDCVVGVFDSTKVSKLELMTLFPDSRYVIHEETLYESTSWFE